MEHRIDMDLAAFSQLHVVRKATTPGWRVLQTALLRAQPAPNHGAGTHVHLEAARLAAGSTQRRWA